MSLHGDFNKLLIESRTIQANLIHLNKTRTPEYLAKTFDKHMLRGNVNTAIRLLDNNSAGGVIKLSDETIK